MFDSIAADVIKFYLEVYNNHYLSQRRQKKSRQMSTEPAVHLDVGGVAFSVSVRTLRSTPDSKLARLCLPPRHLASATSSSSSPPCPTPVVFIDRDPGVFALLLEYAREVADLGGGGNDSLLDTHRFLPWLSCEPPVLDGVRAQALRRDAVYFELPALVTVIDGCVQAAECVRRETQIIWSKVAALWVSSLQQLHHHRNPLTSSPSTTTAHNDNDDRIPVVEIKSEELAPPRITPTTTCSLLKKSTSTQVVDDIDDEQRFMHP
jgi:hypothetical protein